MIDQILNFLKIENLQRLSAIIGLFIIAFIISTLLRRVITIFINGYCKKLNADPTNFHFLKNSVSAIIYTFVTIHVINETPYLHSLGTALFAGAGIFAAIMGFAAQKAFANIITGIFILLFKPFRIGDRIDFRNGEGNGIVEEITLRHTIVRNGEFRRIVIPNNIISQEVLINSSLTDEKIRQFIEVSIGYSANIDYAIAIIQEEAMKHRFYIDNRNAEQIDKGMPEVLVRVTELGEYYVKLKAYVWVENHINGFILKCDLLKAIKERFEEKHIEIPFPYRNITMKN